LRKSVLPDNIGHISKTLEDIFKNSSVTTTDIVDKFYAEQSRQAEKKYNNFDGCEWKLIERLSAKFSFDFVVNWFQSLR
jgi:hypothetical protein